MKKLIVIGLLLLLGCAAKPDTKFVCKSYQDCSSTCGSGCVNMEWAKNYKDPCVNFRAFTCTCVSGTCYTDGKAPKLS